MDDGRWTMGLRNIGLGAVGPLTNLVDFGHRTMDHRYGQQDYCIQPGRTSGTTALSASRPTRAAPHAWHASVKHG